MLPRAQKAIVIRSVHRSVVTMEGSIVFLTLNGWANLVDVKSPKQEAALPSFRGTGKGFFPAFSGSSEEEKDLVCIVATCVGRRV